MLVLDCVACCCAGWSGRRWDWNDCNLLLLISSGRRWAWNDCNLLLLISTRQSNNISVLLTLWWLYWNSLLVSVKDRRPLGGSNVCFRSSARLATHVLQSSSKCKPVSGIIITLPLVVLDPQYYREHWDVGANSRCSSRTV